MNEMRRSNHFVPKMYLKRWAGTDARVSQYLILVSHDSVPVWTFEPVSRVAKHSHLYTHVLDGEETDEIERMLDRDFEAPAEMPIDKLVGNRKMSDLDWRAVIRFVAAQDVRTPARFVQWRSEWSKELPGLLQETLENAVEKATKAQEITSSSSESVPTAGRIPLRVKTGQIPGEDSAYLQGEILVGRRLWILSIQRFLAHTIRVLHQHRWTVLRAPRDIQWITSDNPVLRLNYFSPDNYNFEGGWGSPGTEIMMPLSPDFLLYTQIENSVPKRGSVITAEKAAVIRKCLAENAHRAIFASEPDPEIPRLRPRIVNAEAFREEQIAWREWNAEQSAAEIDLGRAVE